MLGDEAMSDVPLLILANKTDKYASASEDEIRNFFNLHALTTGKVNIYSVRNSIRLFNSGKSALIRTVT